LVDEQREIHCRRKHQRFAVRLQVQFGADALEREGVAENISEGGVYMDTNDVSKPGTELLLRIQFPEAAVVLRAEVVWAIHIPEGQPRRLLCGMGLRFLDTGTEWTTFFRRWAAGQPSSRSHRVRPPSSAARADGV
jgi:hypothetical protein